MRANCVTRQIARGKEGRKEGEEGLERLFGRSLGKKTAALQDRRRRDVLNGADTRTPWTGHIPLGLRFIHDAVVVGRGEGDGGVAQRGGREFEAAAGMYWARNYYLLWVA